MKWPLLVSLPHAGLQIPAELKALHQLSAEDIIQDGDEQAAVIYQPLCQQAGMCFRADIARAFVDMNRAEDDFSLDGVVKTHTCWKVPIYRKPLESALVRDLISKYHRPYHAQLTQAAAQGAKLGLDCHTMAEYGPDVGPDPGAKRPAVCLSNADGTCPRSWMVSLRSCLEKYFQDVSVNHPFQGGYIIRRHAREIPWVQIEVTRALRYSPEQKGSWILDAATTWLNLMDLS